MKQFLRNVADLVALFGLDPRKTIRTFKGLPFYIRDLSSLARQRRASSAEFRMGKLRPCLEDRQKASGIARGHYFHQDLLVARRIFLNNPRLHVDVGSRVDGFVAHVAAFRKIQVFDIRQPASRIPNIEFTQADLMADLDGHWVDYCDSLSCLHAIEHFGLGRYGDPVRQDGYLHSLTNLYRILRQNGKFYFSVPIGPQRIEFNAHRVFSVEYLLALFAGKYRIDHFSYVDDRGDLHEEVPLTADQIGMNFGCDYGCGIFEMTKL